VKGSKAWPRHRQGLARSLDAVVRRGRPGRAGLGVDTDSPTGAFRLYESIGYRATDTSVMYANRPADAFSIGDEKE